jgi:hypothetical protein
MRFASRLIPSAGRSVRGYFLVALGALAIGFGGGCTDNHIGRPCNINVADAGASGGSVAILTSPSLECPSRICIQPAPGGSTLSKDQQLAEGAMCTAGCSTDDDCSDSDPGTLCTKGFICTWPTTSGPFCCQKMCVCHDLVFVPPMGIPEPTTCMPPPAGPSPATCQNVQ